ncbi:MAG: RDD family protein [Alphaproteobacteria bacterium]|nr:RDD family protein [Alphaproteobacteria bacterium]
MKNRYFWRRCFAYAIDLLICSIFVTIIAATLNGAFSSRILAPALLKLTNCEARDDLVAKERMNELLPLEEGQKHQQFLCKQTNMLTTSHYTTIFQKTWKKENNTYRVNLNYYSDENGKQHTYIISDPFLALVAPLIFALFLTKWGQTPGNRLMRLAVNTAAFEKPDIKSSLKREYLKAVIFVIISLFSLYTVYMSINFDIDEAAKLLRSMSSDLEQSGFWKWMALGFAFSMAAIWFQFGSFLRWRGRTYWDQFANLNTGLTEDFLQSKSLKE